MYNADKYIKIYSSILTKQDKVSKNSVKCCHLYILFWSKPAQLEINI